MTTTTLTYDVDTLLDELGHGHATDTEGMDEHDAKVMGLFDWVRDIALEYGATMLTGWLADGEPDPVTVAKLATALDEGDEGFLADRMPDPTPFFTAFAEEYGEELAERLTTVTGFTNPDATEDEFVERLKETLVLTGQVKDVFSTFLGAPVMGYLANRLHAMETADAAFAAQAVAVLAGNAPAPF